MPNMKLSPDCKEQCFSMFSLWLLNVLENRYPTSENDALVKRYFKTKPIQTSQKWLRETRKFETRPKLKTNLNVFPISLHAKNCSVVRQVLNFFRLNVYRWYRPMFSNFMYLLTKCPKIWLEYQLTLVPVYFKHIVDRCLTKFRYCDKEILVHIW